MKPASIIFTPTVLLVAMSCGCSQVEPPTGYVPVEYPRPYQIRAVSADGNVFAFRSWSNPGKDKADLGYWTQAVEHQKVDLDGYTLAKREAFKTDSGRTGTLFEFETGSGQGKFLWWVALFATPYRINVVEAGGPAAQLDRDREKIVKAFRTVR